MRCRQDSSSIERFARLMEKVWENTQHMVGETEQLVPECAANKSQVALGITTKRIVKYQERINRQSTDIRSCKFYASHKKTDGSGSTQ
ncbi:hypothetical protein Ae201684P_010304 [Aphanomyces euteiches]|uniref:Uncharacterized protein n=1 Tax=Aphanomyces euteiches TaxID=100861 RepID=A0A6G0WI99_9STRA|nr:hypothetical protein Ae201684_014907 [Aphanomyces euteiches]KAH9076358.1 hypothetical protein Ae201684P_010304 [Aphanomyces euteiches]